MIVHALRAMFDFNVPMLSVLTIKGTAVIKPERKAAWLLLYVSGSVVISLRSYWSARSSALPEPG